MQTDELVLTLVRAELANLMGHSVMHPMPGPNRDMIQRHLSETVTRHLESEDIGIEPVILEVIDVRSVEQTLCVFRHGDANSAMTT